MKKKEVNYFSIGFLVLAALLAIYLFNFRLTGFAVIGGYENQTSCEEAGYTWENLTEQNCTNVTTCINETIDCEPCLEYEDINGTQGDCINWSSCIEEVCTDEEDCVDIVVGGQCTGDVCDSEHLNLCLDETNCIDVGEGYWYNDICNELECTSDDNCDSGYECSEDGVCVEEEVEETEETPVETLEELPVIFEEPVESLAPELSIQAMDSLILNPLDSNSFNLIATNIGTLPLTACVLSAGGESALWISIPNETKNFNIGEQQSFSFSVNVPEDAEEREYPFSLSVECSELSKTSDFATQVIKKRVDFDLTKVERTRSDRVKVSYLLKDLLGEEQIVYLQFFLLDANDQQVSTASGNHTLDANASKRFKVNIPVNASFKGNLTLSVSLNSEKYSSFVQEPISLGSPTGFLIFEDMGATGNVAVVIIFALIVIVVFFILKRVKHPKIQ